MVAPKTLPDRSETSKDDRFVKIIRVFDSQILEIVMIWTRGRDGHRMERGKLRERARCQRQSTTPNVEGDKKNFFTLICLHQIPLPKEAKSG